MGLFKNREQKLNAAILKLQDQVYYYDNWSFANTPSDDAKQEEKIRKAAQRVYNLGGNPKDHVSCMCRDLMPEEN